MTLTNVFMKIHNVFIAIVTVSILLGIAYEARGYIVEHYFFEQLIHHKSVDYGYANNDDYMHSPAFLSRDTGFPLLSKGIAQQNQPSVTVSQPYTVVIIGDSYVWGLGIKINDRFSNILTKQLNGVRPTRVYTLGIPDDSTLENLSKYSLISQHVKADLYIFLVVFNDSLILSDVRYPSPMRDRVIQECKTLGDFAYENADVSWTRFDRELSNSWKNPANTCVIQKSISLFPHNAIYLVVDNDWIDNHQYVDTLRANDLPVYELSRDSVGIEAYKKYWNEPRKNFQVSAKEGHPSKIANAMYADFLYHEITTNPRWGFELR